MRGPLGPRGGEQGLRAPHGATGLRSEAQGRTGLEWVLHPVMIFDTKTDILEAYRDYQAQTRATGKATLSSRGLGEIP